MKRNYVPQDKLKYMETTDRPVPWQEETKRQADFIEKFFGQYKTYEEFCSVYKIAAIAEEEKIYKKAI